jgi:hypothetical protein
VREHQRAARALTDQGGEHDRFARAGRHRQQLPMNATLIAGVDRLDCLVLVVAQLHISEWGRLLVGIGTEEREQPIKAQQKHIALSSDNR